jgi:hypothetical protein
MPFRHTVQYYSYYRYKCVNMAATQTLSAWSLRAISEESHQPSHLRPVKAGCRRCRKADMPSTAS